MPNDGDDNVEENVDEFVGVEPGENAGSVMTSHGPAPYSGDILDNPDVVWMDDEWTEEEVCVSRSLTC